MDVFIEKIVKKQKGMKEYISMAGIILLIPVVSVLLSMIDFFRSILFVVIIFMIYGAWILVSNLNTEFEYIVTNDEIDIDKIINQKRRKRIISVSCKLFDIVAKVNSENYSDDVKSIQKKFITCSSMDSPDLYFATLNYKNERAVIYFEPDERMLKALKVFIPKKIYI
ncbi:MAG: hypothetical protein WC677_06860 [Clostridia bacterium]|jgi:hypothetical protein